MWVQKEFDMGTTGVQRGYKRECNMGTKVV